MNQWWLWALVGYASGAVPFGLLIGKLHGVDVRKSGSGNLGATNVGRVLGRKWGILCFVLDAIKGTLPVVLAGHFLGLLGKMDLPPTSALMWMATAVAALLGHVFPVWLKFKGGKGVATGLGVVAGFWPLITLPALAAFATWGLLVLITRYVSLASIVGALCVPTYLAFYVLATGRSMASFWPFLVVTLAMALLLVYRHRANIVRLLAGTEPKIGGSK